MKEIKLNRIPSAISSGSNNNNNNENSHKEE